VSEAARRTLSLTARVDFTLTGARAFGGAHAPVFGKGRFDFRAGRGQEIIDLPEAARQEFGNEHAIILPERVYLQPKGTALPRGKRWVRAAVTGVESVSTNFPQFVAQVEGINPMLALAELAWGTTRARQVREELIGRVPAERYRLAIDRARVLSALTGPGTAALAQAIEQQLAGGGGVTSVSFDVWLDKAGRVIEFRTGTRGMADGVTLTRLSSFGVGADVSDPPAAHVVDISSLTPSGERENSGGGDSDGG
jgi:hypothetical protein